ncbi:NUDIX domain-containing protein [Dysgonomonas alginatilytica]|uniref:NUDIX domain-containing protein n=1 Tax=Dysgonomonas alginatilytica TaxID=1605892 RepID=A0A2V3Q0K4_9BACT|nr:NUDIX domain-containing protein [Dysgonomonas alginatilytica]PXV68825.1 NUDIX domain-containing protein [Dysgonomonas alginatilytica]
MTKRYPTAEVLAQANDTFLDSVSVDCVILAFHQGSLKVLLNKFKISDKWMLPGGFVHIDENVDDAANRILKFRVGIADLYLKQFHLFGNCDRTRKEESLKMLDSWGITPENGHWFLKRFVSMGYYALVEYSKASISIDESVEEVGWYDLDKLPELYADHGAIVEKAINTIRIQIGIVPIGYELLPEKFTMPELRLIYEAILGYELDRRNFQRKMLSVGLINRLDEKRKNGAHKAPYLYSFNREKYEEASLGGVHLMPWTH